MRQVYEMNFTLKEKNGSKSHHRFLVNDLETAKMLHSRVSNSPIGLGISFTAFDHVPGLFVYSYEAIDIGFDYLKQ